MCRVTVFLISASAQDLIWCLIKVPIVSPTRPSCQFVLMPQTWCFGMQLEPRQKGSIFQLARTH